MEKVFLNDKLVDIDKAFISAADSGFLYGAGLFETMRVQNGVVFALQDHLQRLYTSAKALSIPTYDEKYLTGAIYQTLQANNLTDARLRLTSTGGPTLNSSKQANPTLVVAATKLDTYPPQYYEKGILVVLSPFRQNTSEAICGHKTTNYFSRILALNIAHQKKSAEALWFTIDNRLAEGCISNVFLVKDSILYTPSLSTPVLPGVARKMVCNIARQNSIETFEKDLSIDDLLEADEVFLTNVIMKVMPINSIEKHVVNNGKPGPITKNIQEYFDNLINSQCGIKR